MTIMFVTFIFCTLLTLKTSNAYITHIDQCEPIEIPRCRAMPYNMTQMPNLMHHNTQENARLVFEKFEILIDQGCSDVLLFLLCSIYVPICAVSLQPEAIPPCRSVCEKARAGCEPLMNAYKVPWPDALECSRLPRYERGVCVSPEAFVTPTKPTECVCKKRKPSYRILRKFGYDYAIRALVLKKKHSSDQEIIYKVKVTQILFSGKVEFPVNAEVILWVNSTCPCPKLRKGRESLILGHEDSLGNKLMVTQLSTAVAWRDSWAARVKRWHNQLHEQSSKGKRNQSSRTRQRGQGQQKYPEKKQPEGQVSSPSPQSLSIQQSDRSPFDNHVHGYTHGGRYYTKGSVHKYSLAAHLSDSH